jgi:hypothetical protein
MKIEFNAKETTQALMEVLDYHQLMEPIIETVTGSSDQIGREVVKKRIEKAMEYRLPVYFTIKYLLILNKSNPAPFPPLKPISSLDILSSVVSREIPCMETHIYKIFQDFLTENQIPECVIDHRIRVQLPVELSNKVTFPHMYMVMTAASTGILEKYSPEEIDNLMKANPRFIDYIWTQVLEKLISGTFKWKDTPEGINYWVDIDSKWKVYLWKHLM